MDYTLPVYAMVFVTFFAAGIVKGVTGMGLPTLAMGLLGAVISPIAAASLLLIPSFVTNVWQLLAGSRFRALLVRLWPMMIGIVVGTVGGAAILTSSKTQLATMTLGAVLVVYALYTLFAPPLHVPRGAEPWLSPSIGLVTGLITGGTGVFVIPAVPYLQALGLEKDDLVQALGLSFTVSTMALAVGLISNQALQTENLSISALAVFPALAGMWAGQTARSTISPQVFRRWFLLCLLLLGTEMLSRPLL